MKLNWKKIPNMHLYSFASALQFSGAENSVYFEREYYHDFSCTFDLLYYPFDTQVNIV